MHEVLEAYRRRLSITYRRSIEADRLLAEALNDMQAYFPAERMPYRGTIGVPGCRVRRPRE